MPKPDHEVQQAMARLFEVAIAYVPDATIEQMQELVDAAMAVGNAFHAQGRKHERELNGSR